MKKKVMALIMALVMCISLAACGGDGQKVNGSGNKEPNDNEEVEPYEATYGDVEIDFWHHMDAERFEALAQMYMDEHPNVKINVLSIGFWDMGSKITPALAGGTAPDIFLSDLASASQRLHDEQTVDLTKHLKARGFDTSEFLPASIDCCTYEGKIAALPYLTDVRILYYNKDHFAEAGITEPPATWDDVLEYTKKLTKFDADGNITQLGFHPGIGNLYPWTMIWTYGGDEWDGETPVFNSPEAAAAMQMAYDIQEAGGGYDAYLLFQEGTQASTVDPFVMGDVSMEVSTNEFATNIMQDNPNLNWGAVILPTSDGVNNHVTWSGGFDLEFTYHGDEDKLNAAIDFGVWLCSEEAQIEYGTKSATLMCNNAAAKAVADARPELGEEYWAAVTKSYDYARYHEQVYAYPDIASAEIAAFNYIMNGTKKVQQALDDGVKIVKQEVANYHLMND